MVRFVGGGGKRVWVRRWAGPGSGMMSVSSALAMVLGGALTGGGGGASAGGNATNAWNRAKFLISTSPPDSEYYRRGLGPHHLLGEKSPPSAPAGADLPWG